MLDGQVPWGETGLQEEEEISQMILTQKDTYITNTHIQLLQTLCNVLFEAYDCVEKLGDRNVGIATWIFPMQKKY